MEKSSKTIGLYVITDSLIFRELFTLWTEEHCEDVKVVGSCGSGKQAVELVERTQPDVVLLDLDLANIDGYDTCKSLLERWNNIKIVAISSNNDPHATIRAANAGLAAYLTKATNTTGLIDAIRTVHFDGKLLHPYESIAILDNSSFSGNDEDSTVNDNRLSRREAEILNHVSNGETNRNIAIQLGISEHTVRNHISNIFHKLGVRNRTEAAIIVSKINK